MVFTINDNVEGKHMSTNEMKYPSLQVAALVASICSQYGYPYSNTKIQKLLYCCYGCVLAVFGQRLCDEYPRAWQFGPVYPRVFNYINKGKEIASVDVEFSLPEDVRELLVDVIKAFAPYSATALSNWTHKPGSPWHRFLFELEGEKNGFIPDDIIAEYFNANVVGEIANGEA